jgi:putative transposase
LYGQLRKYLGQVLHEMAGQKVSKLLEGHLQADHVHMLVSIPTKYSVAQVVGFIKGKNAIHLARSYLGRRKNYTGMHFRARGYFVSTVGADAATTIRDRLSGSRKKKTVASINWAIPRGLTTGRRSENLFRLSKISLEPSDFFNSSTYFQCTQLQMRLVRRSNFARPYAGLIQRGERGRARSPAQFSSTDRESVSVLNARAASFSIAVWTPLRAPADRRSL